MISPPMVLVRSTLMSPLKAGTAPDCGHENESLKRFFWNVLFGMLKLPLLVFFENGLKMLKATLVALHPWDAEATALASQPGTVWVRLFNPGTDDPTTSTVTLPCLDVPKISVVT